MIRLHEDKEVIVLSGKEPDSRLETFQPSQRRLNTKMMTGQKFQDLELRYINITIF